MLISKGRIYGRKIQHSVFGGNGLCSEPSVYAGKTTATLTRAVMHAILALFFVLMALLAGMQVLAGIN